MEQKAFEKKDGCVYFFKHKKLKPIKIGYSAKNNPYDRFEQLKTYAPFGAEIITFVKCSMAMEAERFLHEEFKDKRLQGEWFNITKKDIAYCVSYLKKLEKLHK